jgi:hypothetical protein
MAAASRAAAFRADPLERPVSLRRARGRGGQSGGRPGLGRAGVQAHAGAIEEFRVGWHGFILTRHALDLDDITHWTRMQGRDFVRYELAGRNSISDHTAWAGALLGVQATMPTGWNTKT